ncbi:hypothetical protein SBA2_700005 [Acidobacteriia bacterium SbA2]|nr:hypothetical protein SBA2_700005 [Acidobacteriia bacterium SbA2]
MKRQRKRARRKTDGKRSSIRSAQSRFVPPRTLEEFFAMPERNQEFWSNVGQMVTEMRAGTSRRQAARKFDLDPQRLPKAAGSAMRKLRNGRWVARPHDRLLRVLVIVTRKGRREIGVRDSRQASLLGRHWTAVERYRDTGDASALREFRGKHIIDASGKRVRLLTDRRALDRLGSAGVLSFETLYAKAA